VVVYADHRQSVRHGRRSGQAAVPPGEDRLDSLGLPVPAAYHSTSRENITAYDKLVIEGTPVYSSNEDEDEKDD
jgi:hypothetical protein